MTLFLFDDHYLHRNIFKAMFGMQKKLYINYLFYMDNDRPDNHLMEKMEKQLVIPDYKYFMRSILLSRLYGYKYANFMKNA